MEFFDAYMLDEDDEVDGEGDGEDEGELATSRSRRLQHSTYVNASIRKKLNYAGIGTGENGRLKAISQRYTFSHDYTLHIHMYTGYRHTHMDKDADATYRYMDKDTGIHMQV